VINDICRDHSVPFEIRPPELIRLGQPAARVPRPEPPPTLAEAATAVIRESLQRAEDLLAENRPREAVQEMLWILESIATTFRGTTLPTGTVQGRYFNEIARELRRAGRGNDFVESRTVVGREEAAELVSRVHLEWHRL
jgi:hypothetical protein